jgi:hypothetical protein
VPSPHSLKVVIRWNWAVEAAVVSTSRSQRVRSRASRGAGSVALKNPGETLTEYGRWLLEGTAGPYWCQPSGWVGQSRKPPNTLRTT